MTDWELALLLLVAGIGGWVAGVLTVWAYARHVFRQQAAKLTREAEGLTLGGLEIGHVEPPPDRADGFR